MSLVRRFIDVDRVPLRSRPLVIVLAFPRMGRAFQKRYYGLRCPAFVPFFFSRGLPAGYYYYGRIRLAVSRVLHGPWRLILVNTGCTSARPGWTYLRRMFTRFTFHIHVWLCFDRLRIVLLML